MSNDKPEQQELPIPNFTQPPPSPPAYMRSYLDAEDLLPYMKPLESSSPQVPIDIPPSNRMEKVIPVWEGWSWKQKLAIWLIAASIVVGTTIFVLWNFYYRVISPVLEWWNSRYFLVKGSLIFTTVVVLLVLMATLVKGIGGKNRSQTIYLIYHPRLPKYYVGRTNNAKRRRQQHLSGLYGWSYTGSNKALREAIIELGIPREELVFKVLESRNMSERQAAAAENGYIEAYGWDKLYNDPRASKLVMTSQSRRAKRPNRVRDEVK